ncbi:hypothetical protein Clacol_000325 [Clathrus columnatus]|uniref:Cytochrome P450 n=1 Tax=Clathrus columnatus TaxID=1419009 RepID=A0AAV4ZWE2_9AGAM|nr:hypothetical protein Clacol_000325 [Clathrus columnatus]
MAYGLLLVVLVATAYAFRSSKSRVPHGLRLPPGPPRWPLIGNLLDIPREKQWKTFDAWAKTYGDLVYIEALGTRMLLINSPEYVRELFGERGSIYSNRHHSVVLNELLHMDWTIIMMPYGDVWRRYRGVLSQFFHHSLLETYYPAQMKYTKMFLRKLHESPENLFKHVRYVLGAAITYGIKLLSDNDPLIELSETTVHKITQAAIPGKYLADFLPFLKYVPAWFPGAGFRRELDQLAKQGMDMIIIPVELKNGIEVSSIVSTLLKRYEHDPDPPADHDKIVHYVGGVIYVAGVDTMDGQLLNFFFAMLLHPEVQRTAQAELDRVIEPGSLPTFKDKEQLPYVQAVYKEVLRWLTIANVGVPHVLDQDDIIGDYFIPKGTMIIGNSRTLLRSKEVYGPDAAVFRPERFFEGARDPDWAFGYGRRVCPGKLFGEDTLFIMIACVLYIFTISPIEDENGNPILPREDEDFESGVIMRPIPFQCRILRLPNSGAVD